MKSQCLPFSQIPHTTKLFLDYLAGAAPVRQFYPHSALFEEWFRQVATEVPYEPTRREQVAAALERQNRNWNASPKTLENIQRLRSGAHAVVTGQQVGLFGGPLFAALKALTAIRLAEQATSAGVDSVPIFWLATEDHDLEEVNHIGVPGPEGALTTLATPTSGMPDSPVGKVVFGPEIEPVVQSLTELLGESEAAAWVREAYRPGETFGSAFARLFARLFAEWGVILLDASDPDLHRIASPIYQAAIERASEIDDALLARDKELERAGYHRQVKITPSSTLLFAMQNGARIPVHRRAGTGEFVIKEETLSQRELLDRIRSAPEDFSPNVLLRPVVQDYLLPTLAYAGGAAEVAYFAQAGVVYEALLGRITPVVPRLSATVVDTKSATLLAKYRLSLTDVVHGPEVLRDRLATQTLPEELQSAFDQAEVSVDKSLEFIREALNRLDKTLVDSAANAGEKMHYQLKQLRSRAARAELRQTEVLGRHAQLLSNLLFPNKSLQEREVAGIFFIARYGLNFLRDLHDTMHTECLDHQIITM